MHVAKLVAAFGVLAIALMLCAGEAAAAPPVVCVRNLSPGEIDVVAGVHADRAERPGIYLGKFRARGGACRYADIDGEMNVSFRRSVPQESPGELSNEIRTANGGWIACPAQSSPNGWFVYAVRRGRSGLTCKAGGSTRGLDGPGDYE